MPVSANKIPSFEELMGEQKPKQTKIPSFEELMGEKKNPASNELPKQSDNGLSTTPKGKVIIGETEVLKPEPEENPIDLIEKKKPLTEKGAIVRTGSNLDDNVKFEPDKSAQDEINTINEKLKKGGYEDLEKTMEDFPSQWYEMKGDKGNLPYSKQALVDLYNTDRAKFKDLTNSIKNTDAIIKAAGIEKGNEYSRLNQSKYEKQSPEEFNKNRERQRQIINETLSGAEQDKALKRLNENEQLTIQKSYPSVESSKSYLQDKMLDKASELKPVKADIFMQGGNKPFSIDDYDLASIEAKINPKNPVDVYNFNQYKTSRNVNESLQGVANLDEAAMKFAELQSPQIANQLDYLRQNGEKIPDAYAGQMTANYLSMPEVIKKAQTDPEFAKQYIQTQNNLYTNYPEFAEKEVSNIISQAREDRGMNNWFANIPTKESTDKLVDELVDKGILSEQGRNIYKEKIAPTLGVGKSIARGIGTVVAPAFTPESKIETPGFLEKTGESYKRALAGTARSIEDLSTIPMAGGGGIIPTDNAQRLAQNLRKDATTLSINPTALHEVSSEAGNFTGMAIPMIAGGALFKGLGLTGDALNMALQFEGNNRDNAQKMFPKDLVKQNLYTTLSTAGDATLGHLLPTKQLAEVFNSQIKGEVVNVVNKLSKGEISQAVAKKTLIDKAETILTKIAPQVLKESTKAGGVMSGFAAYHDLVDYILGAKSAKDIQVGQDMFNAFKSGFLGSSVLNVFSAGLAQQNVTGNMLREMGSNPEMYAKIIDEQAKLHPELSTQKEDLLNNLKVASDAAKEVANLDIPEKQKDRFVLLHVAQNIAERKAENLSVDVAKESELNKAKEYKAEKEAIYKGEVKEEPDTKLTEKIEGLDEQGIPITEKTGTTVPTETPTTEEQKVEGGIQPSTEPISEGTTETTTPVLSSEVKRIVEPSKPIQEMDSEEMYQYSLQVKNALKKFDKEFEGKTEKEKEDGGYYNVIDEVPDLRDAAEKISWVEGAEDINDLAKNIRSTILKFDKNNPSEYDLAILNAAKKKMAEFGGDIELLIKEIAKKEAERHPDKVDAEFMAKSIIDNLIPQKTTTPVLTIPIKVDGNEIQVKPLEDYKGKKIVDIDGQIHVYDPKEETVFNVGLEDTGGKGRTINEEANTIQKAKEYIDWESKSKEAGKKTTTIDITPKEELTPTKESNIPVSENPALKNVESTAKALEGVELPNTFVSQDKGGILNRENYYRLAQEKFQESEGLTTEEIFDKNKQKDEFKTQKGRDSFQKKFEQFAEKPINKKRIISEAYHKAKADGTNPELVKAVEEILSKPKQEINVKEKETEIPTPEAVSGVTGTNEPIPSKESSNTKENVGEVPPTKGEVKDIGNKARELAAKIRKEGVLPDWLKANVPEGTKGKGIDINEALAKALETFADIHDATKDFAKAVNEGFKHIKDWFEDNKIPYDEADLKNKFKDEVNGKRLPTDEDTKMANVVNDEFVKGKFGIDALDKIINKLQDTGLKAIYEKAKDKIVSGKITPKEVIERVLTTNTGNEIDQAVLLYHLAELKGKESELQKAIIAEKNVSEKIKLQGKLIEVQNEMMDNALANRIIGRQASTIFRLRQLWVNKEMDIEDMKEQYKASKGISELTKEQEEEIKKQYDEIKDLKSKLVKAKEDLDKAIEENERVKAENEKLKELKDKSTSQKKKDRGIKAKDAIDESNKRIQAAKENLRKLGGNLNAGFDPRIAIEIGKIAAEKVYQGVVKFDELVKNVYDDIKDALPHWTEDDVINHLLTVKDEKGNLIPSKTSKEYIKSKYNLDRSNKFLREKIVAYEKAQKEVALKQFEWQQDRRMDMMKNKPLKERILDKILSWQRFAVLSYPSTFVKLGAVVGHQLLLKPLKFAIQKFISYPISKALGISKKQTLWGNPTWHSLAKYYSTFIRNFALSNLKEHLQGIDTKEMLYGKPMMYDEWASAKGLLEMPGRSHGYIKSFIKNPEFQYAHENLLSYNINKMAEIQKKLDDPNLTESEKDELKKEYENYDVTNEDVMEKINKLSLEHGKWAILMNDNKFVQKLNNWMKTNGVSGALIKSELPVVKIPINYIGRSFATKYGLIQALIGKGENMPSVMKIILKGSKDLTEEQANLLGRTLTIGSMGASFFVLGYFLRKKIKENEDGSFEIDGTHISKNLVHSPEFESIFSGAATGNEFDKEKESEKSIGKWIESFVESDMDIAKKSPFMSMLQYGFVSHVASALISKKDPDKKLNQIENAVFKKIADMTIPGFVKQPAAWMDTKEPGFHPSGEPIKRSVDGNMVERFWQTMELGLPFLRSNVPLTGSKFDYKGVQNNMYKPENFTIETKMVNGKKMDKKLRQYDKSKIEKFISERDKAFRDAVDELGGYVDVDDNGKLVFGKAKKGFTTSEKIESLSDDQKKQLNAHINEIATEQAKKEVFE